MNNLSNLSAFIFAAGEGRRLKPYTDHCPKPMVHVGGMPILEHTLSHLKAAGVQHVAMNTHYKGDVIENFLKTYPAENVNIEISTETELLNTGLGLKRALSLLKTENKPFFAVNGDAFWTNGPKGNVFSHLESIWDSDKMDILLLLQPVKDMHLTKGIGDYDLDGSGHAIRSKTQSGAYMFAGIRIAHPDIFHNTPDVPFSFLELMDRAETAGRLYGVIHDGDWHHISTPLDLERVNDALSSEVSVCESCG